MGGFRGGNNDFKTKIKTAGLQKPTVYYVGRLRKRFFANFEYVFEPSQYLKSNFKNKLFNVYPYGYK